MTTKERIEKLVGWPVVKLEIDHVCTDPHVWRCFAIFRVYDTEKAWACGHGDTRHLAISEMIRTFKPV